MKAIKVKCKIWKRKQTKTHLMIVDKGTARVNYRVIEIESE